MTRILGLLLILIVGERAIAQSPTLPDDVSIAVGETLLLVADVRRAALGSGKVVSLATPQKGQLLLFGESAGETTAELWLADGRTHRVRIRVREQDLSQRLSEVRELLEGVESVQARISGRYIVLEGARSSEEDRARATEVAGLFPGEVLDFIGETGWESMVQLQVRLVEVRRDYLQMLGLRWDSEAAGPTLTATAGAGSGGLSLKGAMLSELNSRIDLLQQRGLAYTIAEPVLSCRSGGLARFVSGGEIPIPVTDGLGATDVQYKEYGVIMELRPRAARDGSVYASLEMELSQVDASVRVGDYPGFLKRLTSTAINLQAGETIAVSGLVMRERGRDRSAVPGLGSLPVAGALFRSKRRVDRETELIVLITPRVFDAAQISDEQSPDQRELMDKATRLQRAGESRD